MHKDDKHAIGVIRDAFVALDGKHPELVAKISAAMKLSGGTDMVAVEAAFREAAVSLVPVDKEAAETLFTMAEIMAQTYNSGRPPPG